MKILTSIPLVVFFSIFSADVLLASPMVYVPLGSANQVIAIDAASSKITATFTGINNPHGLVATPDGEYLIAGSIKEEALKPGQPKDTANSELSLIHPAHGHVMLTIPVAGWTHHQAITPDGRYVISTHGTRGYVSVVDLESNQLIKTIKTGNGPNYTLVSKDGRYAYVSNSASGSISEIDISNWQLTRTLESGPSPEHMVFSKDNLIIYAANSRAGKVSVIAVKSGKIIKQFSPGKGVHGLDISDDGKTLFISLKKGDRLVAINIKNEAVREMKLSPAPYHLNSIRGTGKIYVSSRSKPLIWVIDQKDFKLLETIILPAGEAHQMAVIN